MSYIHQALKKAQAQKEEVLQRGGGLNLPSRLSRPGLDKRALIAAALLGILALAFILYSWLDRDIIQPAANIPEKPRPSVAMPAREETVDPHALYLAGRRHHMGGRPAEAKAFYEQALRRDPGYVPALNNLGVILMAEKDYAEARIRLEKAVRLDPGYADACYNLACLFALTDQPGQGLRYLKRAISLDPKVRGWAREDADLEKIRNEPGFRELVDE